MGVDYALFHRLVDLSKRFQPKGRTLMLGRQAFDVADGTQRYFNACLKRNGRDEDVSEFLQEDGFCETLMQKLGFGTMESLDFSGYENATIVHDLNQPPDEALHEQFDMIIDGGTLEHVFNVPVALEGIFRMLKPGGCFVSLACLNGWPSHGMYQFTPELVWTFWGRACNCEVTECRSIPYWPKKVDDGQVELKDPAITGNRLRRVARRIGPGRVYLYYEAFKTVESHEPRFALQSDYETKWHGHGNAGETRLDQPRS